MSSDRGDDRSGSRPPKGITAEADHALSRARLVQTENILWTVTVNCRGALSCRCL